MVGDVKVGTISFRYVINCSGKHVFDILCHTFVCFFGPLQPIAVVNVCIWPFLLHSVTLNITSTHGKTCLVTQIDKTTRTPNLHYFRSEVIYWTYLIKILI